MKQITTLVTLSLLTPFLTYAAAVKPKLDRPTIVHAAASAAETDLKHYHTLETDDDRVKYLNKFFAEQKPALTDKDLEELAPIVYQFYRKNKYEALAKLVISPAWRKHLMEFNKNLGVVFGMIDSSQPGYTPPAAAKPNVPGISLERDEKDIKAAAHLPGPKREAPRAVKTIVLFAKNPVTGEREYGLPVSRRLTVDPRVSGLLHQTFDVDDTAGDITLDVRPTVLQAMVKYLEQVDQTITTLGLTQQVDDPVRQARNNKRVVDELIKNLKIDDNIFIALIRAAHYMDSPLLLQALVARLFTAGGCGISRSVIEERAKQMAQMDIPDVVKRIIAQQHYLRHWGDVDQELGFPKLVSIPLEELVAYNMMSSSYVASHPEMFRGEDFGVDCEPRTAQEMRQELFIDAINKGMYGLFDAFIRVKDTDKNAALLAAVSRTPNTSEYAPEKMISDLILAGANPNIHFPDGHTPLTLVAPSHRPRVFTQVLLENRANPNLPENMPNVPANEQWTPLMATAHTASDLLDWEDNLNKEWLNATESYPLKQLLNRGADIDDAIERFERIGNKHEMAQYRLGQLRRLKRALEKDEKLAKEKDAKK